MWYPAGDISSLDITTWEYTEREKHFWPPEELIAGKEIKLIVDVGANVGFSTGFFATAWPEAKVVGFEMEEETATRARYYLQGLEDRVTIIDAALGWPEREGIAVLSYSSPVNSLKEYDFGQGDKGEIPVKIISLDRALKEAGLENEEIDILKMDIEGAEWEILNDGGEWSKKTKILIVEAHSMERTIEDFENLLINLGFSLTRNHAEMLVGYRA